MALRSHSYQIRLELSSDCPVTTGELLAAIVDAGDLGYDGREEECLLIIKE